MKLITVTIGALTTPLEIGQANEYHGSAQRVLSRKAGAGGYVIATVEAVHAHGCPATRFSRKAYGKCRCGAAEAFCSIIED